MKLILKSEFGSKVYGTTTPDSDTDYKAIALPSREDILLQKAFKTNQQNTKKVVKPRTLKMI